MIRGCFHPRFKDLNQFADRELGGPKRARVAAHLAECARCRGIVHSIRSLSRAAVHVRAPEPSPEALDRIIARRREGERVILPVAPPTRSPSRFARVGRYAASIAMLMAVAGLLTVATSVRADRSQLELEPSAPSPGAQITAEYHGAMFDEDEGLRLRAEYHYGNGRIERVTAARFVRDGDERTASFKLPKDAVYALFAVEDLDAERVDSNQRRLWELLVHEEDGKPAFAALAAKMDDLVQRNWEVGYETAVEMVELYPETVESWERLLFLEAGFAAALGETHNVPERHREQFKAFEKRLQQKSNVTPDEIVSLRRYAQTVGDPIAADYWRERLATEAPRHPVNVQIRANALYQELYDQPLTLLDSLGGLWQNGDAPVREDVVALAYFTAVRSGNAEALGTWTPRYLQFRPEERLSAARQLLRHAELRDQGMRLIRLELERLKTINDAERRLTESLAAYESWQGQRFRTALVGLGEGLIAEGDVNAGLDSLRLAMEDGWDPGLFHRTADAYLAAGDTMAALPIFARAAADPETPITYVDTVLARLGNHFPDGSWRSMVDQAREEMRQHIVAQAELRYLADDIPVASPDGGQHDLNLLLHDTITVVAFWSRLSPDAVADVSRLREIAHRLEGNGAALVAITNEPPSPDFTASVRQFEIEFPIYHDEENAATHAFSQWTWPAYYVVDSRGRIRFTNRSLEPVYRQVTALRLTEAARTLTN